MVLRIITVCIMKTKMPWAKSTNGPRFSLYDQRDAVDKTNDLNPKPKNMSNDTRLGILSWLFCLTDKGILPAILSFTVGAWLNTCTTIGRDIYPAGRWKSTTGRKDAASYKMTKFSHGCMASSNLMIELD